MIQRAYFNVQGLAGVVILTTAIAGAQQLPASEDFAEYEDIAAWEQLLAENLPPELELPGDEDWQLFWNRIETILHSRSLDDMCGFLAAVRQASGYLDADPDLRPWADWLRQRLDYFEMADIAVRVVVDESAVRLSAMPAPAFSPAPVEPGAKPTTSRPPADSPVVRKDSARTAAVVPPPKTVVPVHTADKRRSLVRDYDRWRTKMARRPMPPNAAVLIPRLKKVFRSEGLPPELVWIAEVESSLNPAACSPVGALGLFQLMPATAQRFGLRTGLFDERKNPEKSARAAAQYLKFLYRAMGSWPLALAAYNAGEGRTRRLIGRKKKASFESIADDLPLETQMFVPKVMALISLRENISPDKLPAPAAAARRSPPVFFLDPLFTVVNACRNYASTQFILAIRYKSARMPKFVGRKIYLDGGVPKWPTGADCSAEYRRTRPLAGNLLG